MTSFDKFLRKYIFRIVGASLCGGLHLLVLARSLFGGGEGPAFVVMLMNFPIVYLLDNFIGRVRGGTELLIFLLAGTLMYVLVGWVIGWLGDWVRQSFQER